MEDKTLVTVIIDEKKWESIRTHFNLTDKIDYNLKQVEVKDNFFENDETHKFLKKESRKAYNLLKEYEFKKRHSIK